MDLKEKALEAFQEWFSKLRVHKASGGPAKGTISAGLVVLERLKTGYNLDLQAHRAPGGSQIKGAGGQALKKISPASVRRGLSRPRAEEQIAVVPVKFYRCFIH
jgi:hypothetical protein